LNFVSVAATLVIGNGANGEEAASQHGMRMQLPDKFRGVSLIKRQSNPSQLGKEAYES